MYDVVVATLISHESMKKKDTENGVIVASDDGHFRGRTAERKQRNQATGMFTVKGWQEE